MIHLYNQDCMEAMASMEDNQFDLAIVDPPYGWGETNQTKKLTDERWNLYENKNWNVAPTKEYFDELFRVSKHQIIWGGNYFDLPPTKCFIFWDKQQSFFRFADGELAWTSFNSVAKKFVYGYTNFINYEERFHPTQKPVALYTWLLGKYAQQGWKILDTHLGSGSSAIAAHDMGFEFHGYELDEEYYEAASKRLQQHQRQLKLPLEI